MDSEYKVGALADLISEGGGGGGGKTLTMASLFTTEKKQREAAAVVSKVKKTNKKAKRMKMKKLKEVGEAEEEDGEESKDAKSKTPSTQDLMKREDEKDEKQRKRDPEQEERTVFVGNLPVSATKKQLMKMFCKFGNVETVRFRGAARPDMNTTKKIAVIKRAIHENRHNISAYVRFKERSDAEKAAAATNGVKDGDNVLRVDLAASPADKKIAHEQKLAVFVGNMSYAVEENALHSRFSKCGTISSVRIVRDAATGIGKGFGYVNFASEDSVEIALTLNGSELDGRKMRVTRCVRKAKPVVGLPNSKSRPQTKTKRPTQAKKVTRKKLRDMNAPSFQGQSFDDKKSKMPNKGELNKSGKGKKFNKGEKAKKKLSQKLLKS